MADLNLLDLLGYINGLPFRGETVFEQKLFPRETADRRSNLENVAPDQRSAISRGNSFRVGKTEVQLFKKVFSQLSHGELVKWRAMY